MRSVGMAMNNDFEIIESSAPFLVGETTGLSNIFLLMKTSVPSGIEFFFFRPTQFQRKSYITVVPYCPILTMEWTARQCDTTIMSWISN